MPAAVLQSRLEGRARYRYHRRRVFSVLGWIVCGGFFVLLGFALLDILFEIAAGGFPALNGKLFTESTQGVSGGLANAIEGTALLTPVR